MALTRAQLIDRVQNTLGDTSSEAEAFLEGSLDHMLFYLWDLHDWTFKHQTGTFNSVIGTEEYDLSSTSANIRSSRDVELLYNTTQGQRLPPVELREIRLAFPKEDQSSTPYVYAPWGTKSIILAPKPTAVETYKYQYVAKPTLPTDDADDLETETGTPDYVLPLLEALVMKEGMQYYDDSRYLSKVREIETVLIPRAINADMRYLEDNARIKDWEEERTSQSLGTIDDQLRYWWWGNGN